MYSPWEGLMFRVVSENKIKNTLWIWEINQLLRDSWVWPTRDVTKNEGIYSDTLDERDMWIWKGYLQASITGVFLASNVHHGFTQKSSLARYETRVRVVPRQMLHLSTEYRRQKYNHAVLREILTQTFFVKVNRTVQEMRTLSLRRGKREHFVTLTWSI